MKTASLYPQTGVGGTGNIDLEVDDLNYNRVIDAEISAAVQVEATAVKGYTGNVGQVFLKKNYKQFFIEGVTLDDVQILQVQGQPGPNPPSGNLYPQGARILLEGTRNQV